MDEDTSTRRVEEIRWGLSTNGIALRQPSPSDSIAVHGDARFDVPSNSWTPYSGQPQRMRISNPLGGQRTELKNSQPSSQALPAPSVGVSAEDGHDRPDAPLPDNPPVAGPRGLKRKADSEIPHPTPPLTAVKLEAGSSLRDGSQHDLDSAVASTQGEKSKQQSATPSPPKVLSVPSRETTENASSGDPPPRPPRTSAKGGEDEATGRRKAISAIKGKPHEIPRVLPHESVFPIQIGCELFRLSGASISSDGQLPSPNPSVRRPRLRILEHRPTSPSSLNVSFRRMAEMAVA